LMLRLTKRKPSLLLKTIQHKKWRLRQIKKVKIQSRTRKSNKQTLHRKCLRLRRHNRSRPLRMPNLKSRRSQFRIRNQK
jgi:hypothetical protein